MSAFSISLIIQTHEKYFGGRDHRNEVWICVSLLLMVASIMHTHVEEQTVADISITDRPGIVQMTGKGSGWPVFRDKSEISVQLTAL